jgi:hypothetical protein
MSAKVVISAARAELLVRACPPAFRESPLDHICVRHLRGSLRVVGAAAGAPSVGLRVLADQA